VPPQAIYAVLIYAVLIYAVLIYAVLIYAVLIYAVLIYAVLIYAVLIYAGTDNIIGVKFVRWSDPAAFNHVRSQIAGRLSERYAWHWQRVFHAFAGQYQHLVLKGESRL
jgi:hypothetical protein